MNKFKTLILTLLSATGCYTFADDFAFDRTTSGFSTTTTPVGKLAWEQGLPSVKYYETSIDGAKQKTVALNGDILLRTGLTNSLELQLGWMGPSWSQQKYAGEKTSENGLGDVRIGLKKAIDLGDDRMQMALLAQALIATGNDNFSQHDDTYSLSSKVSYQQNDLLNTSITMRYELQNSDWAVAAIPSLAYKFGGKWSGYSEFVYRKAESQNYQYGLGTGIIYAINHRAQVDANIGVDLEGDDKSYNGGFGFSYLF